MKNKKVLVPLPTYGYDPSETAIPWKILTENNIEVQFITPNGRMASADELILKGKNLGIWKWVLRARKDAVLAHNEMENSKEFCNPHKYDAVDEKNFDAILLPGGHDKKVKEYLESEILQNLIVDFFQAQKPVAAVCHGVVLVARSIDSKTGKSVIHKYKTTCLLKDQEKLAYNLTKLWLKDYYLTYPEITVEDEVLSILVDKTNLKKGPKPMFRDSRTNLKSGFTVRDRNYLSARWPGDIYSFSNELVKMIQAN